MKWNKVQGPNQNQLQGFSPKQTNKQTKCKAVLQTFHHQLLSKGLTTRNPPVTFHIFLTFFYSCETTTVFLISPVHLLLFYQRILPCIQISISSFCTLQNIHLFTNVQTIIRIIVIVQCILWFCLYSSTGLILYPSVNGWTSHGPSVQSCTLLLFSVCVFSRLFLHSTCRPPGVEPVLP